MGRVPGFSCVAVRGWQGRLPEKTGLLVCRAAGDGGLRGGGPDWGDVRESGTHRRRPKLQAPGLPLRKLVWREERCQPGTGPQELS